MLRFLNVYGLLLAYVNISKPSAYFVTTKPLHFVHTLYLYFM